MSDFYTKLDFSDNRQAKQRERTVQQLSGTTTFGLPFSALTSGPNLNTTGITETQTLLLSTFSGNATTTIYTWSDSRMSLGEVSLSAITPSNSATTQNTGQVFTENNTIIIDGNTSALDYSGVSFNVTVTGMTDLGGSTYSGEVSTLIFEVLSAGTLDYLGRTIWADVSGITRTDRLIITDNPQVGYVWTCADTEGMGSWSPSSGVTADTNTYTTGSTLVGTTVYYDRNNALSAYTTDLSLLPDDSGLWSASTGTNGIVVKYSDSLASGDLATAQGTGTTASGSFSHAEGSTTIASGVTAHAEGSGTVAGGTGAHAEGANTIASGATSHAEGLNTSANNTAAHAEGYLTIASEFAGHAEGWGSVASATTSHVEGYFTTAGQYSHAEGFQTTAYSFGDYGAHAEGKGAVASNDSAHAEGSNTLASGGSSHAEGNLTTASSSAAHAEGFRTTASGVRSHSGGYDSIASGSTSFVHGSGSTAGGDHSVVLGRGIVGLSADTTYVDNFNIKTVGAGPGTTDLGVDANGNVVDQASDRKLKENINTIEDALETVLKLRGVTYNWKDREKGGNALKLGFIAQEVDEVIPQLAYHNINGDYMGVHYKDVTALLVEAMKELSTGVTSRTNKHLETQTILAEDNNIELNFNGDQETSVGGGLMVLHGMGENIPSVFVTDINGDWVTNNILKPKGLTIPEFTPKSTNDSDGVLGEITRDDDYLYVKSKDGWKRTNLENF